MTSRPLARAHTPPAHGRSASRQVQDAALEQARAARSHATWAAQKLEGFGGGPAFPRHAEVLEELRVLAARLGAVVEALGGRETTTDRRNT